MTKGESTADGLHLAYCFPIAESGYKLSIAVELEIDLILDISV